MLSVNHLLTLEKKKRGFQLFTVYDLGLHVLQRPSDYEVHSLHYHFSFIIIINYYKRPIKHIATSAVKAFLIAITDLTLKLRECHIIRTVFKKSFTVSACQLWN